MSSRSPVAALYRLAARPGRSVLDALAGACRSAALHPGLDLDAVRPYVLGDDVRTMAWHVTARTGRPHVRLAHPERALTLWLALETGPGMDALALGRSRRAAALEIAAALAFAAQRAGDRTGLLPGRAPVRDRASVARAIARLEREDGMPLEAKLRVAAGRAVRRGLLVVITHAAAQFEPSLLRAITARHALVVLRLIDPADEALPPLGLARLAAPGTAPSPTARWIDTASAAVRERYAQAARAARDRVASTVVQAGGAIHDLPTAPDPVGALLRRLGAQRGRPVVRRRPLQP